MNTSKNGIRNWMITKAVWKLLMKLSTCGTRAIRLKQIGGTYMGTSNRIELEREWKDASNVADHWVDVIADLRRQIEMADTLQARLEKAKEEFREANQKVIKLSNELAQL